MNTTTSKNLADMMRRIHKYASIEEVSSNFDIAYEVKTTREVYETIIKSILNDYAVATDFTQMKPFTLVRRIDDTNAVNIPIAPMHTDADYAVIGDMVFMRIEAI